MNDMLSIFPGSEHLFRLQDGSICRIRSIGPDDRHLLQDGFERLSPNSRRLRFFGAKKSLTETELEFLTSPDGHDHIALGAVRLDASGNEVEGLATARCIRHAPDSDTAELAIAVIDDLQGNGLGGRLLKRLVKAARQQGIRRFNFEVLAENEAMRALAVRLGSDARWLDDGVLEYDYPLPEPDLRDQSPWLSELFTLYEAHLESAFRAFDQAMGPVVGFYDWLESSRPNSLRSASGADLCPRRRI